MSIPELTTVPGMMSAKSVLVFACFSCFTPKSSLSLAFLALVARVIASLLSASALIFLRPSKRLSLALGGLIKSSTNLAVELF